MSNVLLYGLAVAGVTEIDQSADLPSSRSLRQEDVIFGKVTVH